MRRSFLAVLVALLGLGTSAPALGSGSVTVKVADYKFVSKTVHIKRGTTVTWKWAGEDPHNVTGKGFRSRTQRTGTFRHRFTKPGTYKYVCTLHNTSFAMHGRIIVG